MSKPSKNPPSPRVQPQGIGTATVICFPSVKQPEAQMSMNDVSC